MRSDDTDLRPATPSVDGCRVPGVPGFRNLRDAGGHPTGHGRTRPLGLQRTDLPETVDALTARLTEEDA